MDPKDVGRSKRLSLVLRHRPESVGLQLDPHGWVGVEALLAALDAHGSPMTRQELKRVVASNDKLRFELDDAHDRIRARQGHSLEVDLSIVPSAPPAVLFHGTPRRNVESIFATGLDRMRRQHVHLSVDVHTAERVGARRGHAVVLRVDAAAMSAAGRDFWLSSNGVWLTERVELAFLSINSAGRSGSS